LSYYGNQWTSCTNEIASDRGLVVDGLRSTAIISAFWDEGTFTGSAAFLSGAPVVIGGYFSHGIDPTSVCAAVQMREFREVEQVNVKTPLHTRAALQISGIDIVYLWTANRAAVAEEYVNTFGWQYRETNPPGVPPTREWALSYQLNSPFEFFSVQDGFGTLGMSWRDYLGHFCGRPGMEYFLGVDPLAENDTRIRRGFRAVGDRFEKRLAPECRGQYLGRIVTKAGFRGYNTWDSPDPELAFYQFDESRGWPPGTLEEEGYVFVCTRTGVCGEHRPDFASAIRNRGDSLSPIFSTGQILTTWRPHFAQQLGMLKRPTHRALDGRYYHYVCESVTAYARTGNDEPLWTTALDSMIPDNEVTWRCLGPDPDDGCIVDGPTGLQWTCVGRVAEFAEYGPVYEKGKKTTYDGTTVVLDFYPILDNSCTQFDVIVTAYHIGSSGPEGEAFTLRAAYCRNGGNIDEVIAPTTVERSSRHPWNAVLVRNGTNIEVQVTGGEEEIRWSSIRLPA
jgi:hypothetical protein